MNLASFHIRVANRLAVLSLFASIGIAQGCKAPESRSASQEQQSELPKLGEVPSFTLTDQGGASFSKAALLGTPWVANTFFTSCRSICPNLMSKVSDLHSRTASFEPPVRFISITVDPDNDTPKALAEYRRTVGASPRWTFLTGEFGAIRHLVVEGFHTAMGQRKPNEPAEQDISHSGKLFLVDAAGHIRGYFRADDAGVDAAIKALKVLTQ